METVSLDHINNKTFSQNPFLKLELSIQTPQLPSYLFMCYLLLGMGILNGNILPVFIEKEEIDPVQINFQTFEVDIGKFNSFQCGQ